MFILAWSVGWYTLAYLVAGWPGVFALMAFFAVLGQAVLALARKARRADTRRDWIGGAR